MSRVSLRDDLVYRDEGTEISPPDLRFCGLALGVSPQARLARILDDLGHPDWLLRVQSTGTFKEFVREVERDAALDVFAKAMRIAAADGRPHVRAEVARRVPESLIDVIEILARDALASVRASLAANESVPAQVLAFLAHDADAVVRYRVAGHPRTPRRVYDDLMRDLAADGALPAPAARSKM